MKDNTKINGKKFKVGGAGAYFTLIVCSLLMAMNFMDRMVLSAVLEPMKIDLGLSDTQVGLINTAFLLSIAFFSFPVSYLVDRWSRRKSLAIMAIIWSFFTFITGLGKSFIGVLIPRTIVGAGEAGFSAAGTAMITASFPAEKRSRVLGIFNMSVPIGMALGVVLGGYISTNHGGWRAPFIVFAIPGIILGIIAFFLKDYKTIENLDNTGKREGIFVSTRKLLQIPTLRWLYLGYGFLQMLTSVLIWVPAYLMRSHKISEAEAGIFMGGIALMSILGAPIGGFLADLWQRKNKKGRMYLPALSQFISAILLAGAFFCEFKGIGLLLGYAYGVIAVMSLPALGAVSQDVVTPAIKGMSTGLTVVAMYFIGGWAPYAVGGISDMLGGGVIGLKIALMIMSSGGILAGICFWIGSRHYPSDMDKVKGITLEGER
ncbi:MAG: MFS transporter [Proteobacteria bacterium]|nr:MFS transporter [Pseudomonadota bacterium]